MMSKNWRRLSDASGSPQSAGFVSQAPLSLKSASKSSMSSFVVDVAEGREHGGSRCLLPDRVDDLVLEDAGEPGLEARLAGEAAAGERGEQRVLHDVLRGIAIAQLQLRHSQQVAAMRFDLAGEVFGHGTTAMGRPRGGETE